VNRETKEGHNNQIPSNPDKRRATGEQNKHKSALSGAKKLGGKELLSSRAAL